MNKRLFDEDDIQNIDHNLKMSHTTEATATDILEGAVSLMLAMLEGKKSPVFLDFDRDHATGPITGLTVFNGNFTSVIPASVSHRTVRLNQKPFYVGREDGIAVLLHALSVEIETVVKGLVRH